MPGIGELFDPEFSGDGFIEGVPFNYTFGAHLVGKSVTGIRAEAVDILLQFISEQNTNNKTISAFAEGEACAPILYYSIVKPPFEKIVFNWSCISN